MNSREYLFALVIFAWLVIPQFGWSQTAEISAGAALYHDFCSVCHGDNGDGDSHARQGLKPPPKDFTSDEVRNTLSRDSIFSVIKYGKAGTAMVAWQSRLDDDAIYAIVDYILAAFMSPEKTLSETRGYEIYHGSCSVCHGDDGAAAKWAGSSLKPPPRDFTSEQSRRTLNKDIIAQAVKEGRPGTAMTSFKRQLSDEDIKAVADYILAAFLASAE